MLPTQKLGVLYSDSFIDDTYHIVIQDKNGAFQHERAILVQDRRASAHTFEILYHWMHRLGINRLWVHPDTKLSVWIMRGDFTLIKKTPGGHLLYWSSPETMLDGHPKGIRLFYMGDTTRWIFFPAHIEMIRAERKHQHDRGVATWVVPAWDHLYNTVSYLEKATDFPLLWSPAYSSKAILRSLHTGKDIVAFVPDAEFNSAYRKMAIRPTWVHRGKEDKKRGIPEIWLLGKVFKDVYIHGFDKNMQFLGACANLILPNEATYKGVPGSEYDKDTVGFWEYEILDVEDSMFNSYECYCPLDKKRNWASTNLIHFAMIAGIKLLIHRGMVFEKEKSKRYLDEWAYLIWRARKQLKNVYTYPDVIASSNAIESTKKYYVDMIGQFCAEYSDEYSHQDWNTMIVHEAIARQGYTLLSRPELRGNIVLVVHDSFYLLSHEQDVYKAYPSLLKYEDELRGYKHIGTCKLSDDVIDTFANEQLTAMDIESRVKREMIGYATI